MLFYAIIFITAALVFYSTGVWSEKIQGSLKLWHVIVFWTGFVCDTTGTTLMGKLAKSGSLLSFHGITGLSAIILMLVHVIWATFVVIGSNEKSKLQFHRFSIVVWLVWLIPYISGVVYGMTMR